LEFILFFGRFSLRRIRVSKESDHSVPRIDQFFAGPGARADRWQNLAELAEAWADGSSNSASFEDALGEMIPTEEYHAFPGPQLMSVLRDHAAANDAAATAALVRRITRSLLNRSFRQYAGEWDTQADSEEAVSDVLPPALGREDGHRPYFEVLIVTGAPSSRWNALRAEWRRLRRPLDPFVYEPVFVGSFEDAFCAAILNAELAAVIIHEGFPFRSRHDAPVLRSLFEVASQQQASQASALHLAQVLKRVRPELDLYLVSNGRVEDIAGSPRRTGCDESFMPSRSCSSCTSPYSKAFRRDMKRHSSTI
jgi:arginine decarboxylase